FKYLGWASNGDLYDLKNHQQGVCERELHILDNNEVEDIQHPSTSKPVLTSPLKSPAPPELLPRKVLDTKTCSLCGRFFTRTSDMARHMRSHSKERPFWCISCDKSFKYSYDLKRHQRDLCKKRNLEDVSQDDGNNLSQQIEDLQPEKAECQSVERSVSLATDQNQIPNSNVQPSNKEPLDSKTCYVCGRILTRTSDMERHLKSHSKERPFHCGTCERSFKYKDTLKKHHVAAPSSAPTLKEPKPCGVCGKVFNRASGMAIHMRSHSSERPFPCLNCDKTFAQLSYLVVHERVHSGEYPYQCSVCPGKFRTANSLTIHSRKHTGEKPFLCWQCGKSYRAASELAVHMGTHSEEKPFSCSQCDMTYRTKTQMNTHIEQVHDGVRFTFPPSAAKTALICRGMDTTRPVKVCCGIWHQDVSSPVSCELGPPWIGTVCTAHLTDARLD
uniref:C2H2-type domain-containing protein n=1 Tax=Esox lucius TaxID=8010 RepID=A0AAY5KIL9_ESOLU